MPQISEHAAVQARESATDPRAKRPTALIVLRGALSAFTAAMVGVSWPLWTASSALPRVPFAPTIPEPVFAVPCVLLVALLFGVLVANRKAVWDLAFGVSAGAAIWLILADQHRFQPWMYQYLVVGVVLAVMPPAKAIRLARWWYAALYFHSALSKLDVSFRDELGLVFLLTLLRPLKVDPLPWSWVGRDVAVLLMPLGELAVSIALPWRRFRRIGLVGACVLHVTLLAILGPAGLRHSTIVLLWNLAILTEVLLVFQPALDARLADDSTRWGRVVRAVGVPIVLVGFGLGVNVPLLERSGWFDAWPSHALYASHVEWLSVEFDESVVPGLPPALHDHLGSVREGRWRPLDLTGWSRADRGTPIYPQNRAGLGLAESLAARYGDRGPVRVVLHGPANRWNGRRIRTELVGVDAIRRHADRYALNAHPAER